MTKTSPLSRRLIFTPFKENSAQRFDSCAKINLRTFYSIEATPHLGQVLRIINLLTLKRVVNLASYEKIRIFPLHLINEQNISFFTIGREKNVLDLSEEKLRNFFVTNAQRSLFSTFKPSPLPADVQTNLRKQSRDISDMLAEASRRLEAVVHDHSKGVAFVEDELTAVCRKLYADYGFCPTIYRDIDIKNHKARILFKIDPETKDEVINATADFDPESTSFVAVKEVRTLTKFEHFILDLRDRTTFEKHDIPFDDKKAEKNVAQGITFFVVLRGKFNDVKPLVMTMHANEWSCFVDKEAGEKAAQAIEAYLTKALLAFKGVEKPTSLIVRPQTSAIVRGELETLHETLLQYQIKNRRFVSRQGGEKAHLSIIEIHDLLSKINSELRNGILAQEFQAIIRSAFNLTPDQTGYPDHTVRDLFINKASKTYLAFDPIANRLIGFASNIARDVTIANSVLSYNYGSGAMVKGHYQGFGISRYFFGKTMVPVVFSNGFNLSFFGGRTGNLHAAEGIVDYFPKGFVFPFDADLLEKKGLLNLFTQMAIDIASFVCPEKEFDPHTSVVKKALDPSSGLIYRGGAEIEGRSPIHEYFRRHVQHKQGDMIIIVAAASIKHFLGYSFRVTTSGTKRRFLKKVNDATENVL